MSLQDARYAFEELAAGRPPDSSRALAGLHALISARSTQNPTIELAADLLQQFVIGRDRYLLQNHDARDSILEAIRELPER